MPEPRRPRAPVLFALAVVGALLPAGQAAAWDDASHDSIARAALRLSPAAASRIPPDLREPFLQATRTTDVSDILCRKHVGPLATQDPPGEAAKSIDELRRAWDGMNAFRRAEALARIVHFAADCSVPTGLRRGRRVFSWAFFVNRDLVVYRDPTPLKAPFADALRRRGALAEWADEGAGADSLAYRLAVNLAVDVLLLFPPVAGGPAAPDDGPVLFLVNRVATQAPITGKPVDGVSGTGSALPADRSVPGEGGKPALGPAEVKVSILSKRGVQIAEWATRRAGERTQVRAVLLNNDDVCASRITLRTPTFRHVFPEVLSPAALRAVSFDLPAAVSRNELSLSSDAERCPGRKAGPGEVSGWNRLVYWNTGGAPLFENPATPEREGEWPGFLPASGSGRSEPVSRLLVAEVDPPLLSDLPSQLHVGPLSCDAAQVPWSCKLSVRSTGGDSPRGLVVQLLVTPRGGGTASTRETVTFDLSGLPLGVRREVAATLKPRTSHPPGGLEVVAVTAR